MVIGESAIEPFNPLALASASLADLRKRPKYIPQSGPAGLYAIYESACSRAHHANKASSSTFHREFKQWDQILLFPNHWQACHMYHVCPVLGVEETIAD